MIPCEKEHPHLSLINRLKCIVWAKIKGIDNENYRIDFKARISPKINKVYLGAYTISIFVEIPRFQVLVSPYLIDKYMEFHRDDKNFYQQAILEDEVRYKAMYKEPFD